MANKYKQLLMDSAEALDKELQNDAFYTRQVVRLIDSSDDTASKTICDELVITARDGDKEIRYKARRLKDCLIGYYGHKKLRDICNNEKSELIEDEKTIDELLEELNELVGLQKVKNKVNDLIAFQCIQKKRENEGLYAQKSTLHMAFTGNPGTGKTTVARIVGRIYKQLGLLSKGHFIEASRTDLIAGYQGQTALKVKGVISRAKGGVLFIDEAYSITENDHSDSYGRVCLTELTKALEDYRDDLVVIVAGYTEPMHLFFESNPGLRSRFNIFIEFDDYQVSELMDMMVYLCDKNFYKLSKEAYAEIDRIIREKVENKDNKFANGRLVRNMFEEMTMNHARRLYKIAEPTKDELMIIDVADVSFIEGDI